MENTFHRTLLELESLHDLKEADYSPGEVHYKNIRASGEWGVEPWIAAMVRANDKIKRLQQYATEGKLANESVEDSLSDLAVYAIISLILVREKHERDFIAQS